MLESLSHAFAADGPQALDALLKDLEEVKAQGLAPDLTVEKLLYRGIGRGAKLHRNADVERLVDALEARGDARGGASSATFALATVMAGACLNGLVSGLGGAGGDAGDAISVDFPNRASTCAAWIAAMQSGRKAVALAAHGNDNGAAEAVDGAKGVDGAAKAEKGVDGQKYYQQLRSVLGKAAAQLDASQRFDAALDIRVVSATATARHASARDAATEVRRAAAMHAKQRPREAKLRCAAYAAVLPLLWRLADEDAPAYADFGAKHAAAAAEAGLCDFRRQVFDGLVERLESCAHEKRHVALACVWASCVVTTKDGDALQKAIDGFDAQSVLDAADCEAGWRAMSRVAALAAGGAAEAPWERGLERLAKCAAVVAFEGTPALRFAAAAAAADAGCRAAALAARSPRPGAADTAVEHVATAVGVAAAADGCPATSARVAAALQAGARVLRACGQHAQAADALRVAAALSVGERRVVALMMHADALVAAEAGCAEGAPGVDSAADVYIECAVAACGISLKSQAADAARRCVAAAPHSAERLCKSLAHAAGDAAAISGALRGAASALEAIDASAREDGVAARCMTLYESVIAFEEKRSDQGADEPCVARCLLECAEAAHRLGLSDRSRKDARRAFDVAEAAAGPSLAALSVRAHAAALLQTFEGDDEQRWRLDALGSFEKVADLALTLLDEGKADEGAASADRRAGSFWWSEASRLRALGAVSRLRDTSMARNDVCADFCASKLVGIFGGTKLAYRVAAAAAALAFARGGFVSLAEAQIPAATREPLEALEALARAAIAAAHAGGGLCQGDVCKREDVFGAIDVATSLASKTSLGAVRGALLAYEAHWAVRGDAAGAAEALAQIASLLAGAPPPRQAAAGLDAAVLGLLSEARPPSRAGRARARADALQKKAELWFVKGDAARALSYAAKAKDVASALLPPRSASSPTGSQTASPLCAAHCWSGEAVVVSLVLLAQHRMDRLLDEFPLYDFPIDASAASFAAGSAVPRSVSWSIEALVSGVDALMVHGDGKRSLGQFDEALGFYAQASAAASNLDDFAPKAFGVSTAGAVYARRAPALAWRVARCCELSGDLHKAERLYRAALPQASPALDRAVLRYRLGRLILATASDGARRGEAAKLLANALVLARALEAFKLVRNAARALAVALLQDSEDADDDYLIALLVHSSLGVTQRAVVFADAHGAAPPLVEALREFDVRVDSALKTFRSARRPATNAWDLDWVVCGVCVSPTGHVVASRLETDGCGAVNVSRKLPGSWWRPRPGNASASPAALLSETLQRASDQLKQRAEGDAEAFKNDWWNQRRALDSDIESIVRDFEQNWLGPLKLMLQPAAAIDARLDRAVDAVGPHISREVVQLCLAALKADAADGDVRWFLEHATRAKLDAETLDNIFATLRRAAGDAEDEGGEGEEDGGESDDTASTRDDDDAGAAELRAAVDRARAVRCCHTV
ncbi:hypothetical protein M885DRAFT_303482 [Pelagophyceae sp. CCMP2097]|nr:hypothetical protein M885DRAFT_303482 [Pelagophyceae sp. CCMP2097]